MRGGKLTNKLIKHIQVKHRAKAVNVIKSSTDGCSDIIACVDGVFYALEVKAGKDTEKEHQRDFINGTIDAGGKGGFVRSTEDVDRIISEKKSKKLAYKSPVLEL